MTPSPELYPWITVAAIVWGLLDIFFGYKVFKITLAVFGGLVGGVLGQTAGVALGYGLTGQIIGFVFGGLIGAGLAWLLYLAAVFLAGFGFGATLAVLLLAHFNHMAAMLGGCVLGIIGGFVALKMQQVLIVLSTSLIGAFRVVVALAYFTSKIDWFWYFQNPQNLPALIDNNTWMFPAILVLAVIGAVAQFGLGGSSGEKKKAQKD
ncbi:TM7S3/TM198-like domain-containing protein [Oleiharenicola lentus]|uniref:TM7S3/TM198-like domain-containing protein n=1 Tax=Oleiharenicola lentus TaxID=2508720 RepID=UPI003F674E34